ncbi:MAG: SpoIIE family protein phosphatase [Bacteroidota bacterium]
MLNYFQEVLTQTSVIYLVLDPSGKVIFVSPALQQILGLNPAATIGKNWFEITRNNISDQLAVKKRISDFIQSDENTLPTYVTHLQDVNQNDVHILWNTIKASDGQLIGTGQDITQKVIQEKLITDVNNSLKEVNTYMKDSINYAARLQKAILKNPDVLREEFTDLSIFYRPKDVVSGDIYFYSTTKKYQYIAAIDCTGHGVPGAMLSLIANTLLRNIIKRKGVHSVSEILKKLDKEFINYLNENNSSYVIADGLDIALIQIDKAKNCYTFAGAFRPMIVLNNGVIEVVKASKYPIGFYEDVEKTFEEHKRPIVEGERIVLFSDGFPDQFGGERSKKINRIRFLEMLESIDSNSGIAYEQALRYLFEGWKGTNEQTDDVTVISFKI